MEFYETLIILTFVRYSYCGYTGYNMLLWLSSDEDLAPSNVWSDSSSSYNSGSNTTINNLLLTAARGYRNTFIDNWSSNPPDKIRVTYRNKDGAIIFKAKFNSTGSSYTDWYSVSKSMDSTWSALSYELSHAYTSYSVEFTMSENSLDVLRYRAASVRLSNGTVVYIVGVGRTFALLPATPTSPGDCYASYDSSNPFSINTTRENMTHIYCSAFCRERNYQNGGVHGETCSCLNAAVSGPTLTACSVPCEGNNEEMCGGSLPPAVVFNSVNTDIDLTQLDKPLIVLAEVQVTGDAEGIILDLPTHLYGFNVSIESTNLPASIRLILHYRSGSCNGAQINNSTYQKAFSVAVEDQYYLLEIEPLYVQCVYISLYDNTTSDAITFPVNMTAMTIESHNFVTAQFFTIEASWQTVEEQTTTPTPTSSDECECECWVYNLLYGDSPYNNLSYEQIQDALRNVTEKIEKELAVNKSTLSSTIRKKTSAEDKRTSATAMGYSLGVAMLVASLGALLLSDLPKMIGSFYILRENFMSRFDSQEEESMSITDNRHR